MKSYMTRVLGVIVAMGALQVSAGNLDRAQLADCKTALSGIYGDEYQFRLKSVRGGRHQKLMIKTIPAEGRGATVTCWRDAAGELRLTDRDGVALVPSYETTDKVSQVN